MNPIIRCAGWSWTSSRLALRWPDGSLRFVIAHRDPGLADTNWLDTAGHDRGFWNLRWMEPSEDRLPTLRLVKFSELASL